MDFDRIARICVAFLLLLATAVSAQVITPPTPAKRVVFHAGLRSIQYVGRVDFSTEKKPKIWAPGGYIRARFLGTYIEVNINDQMLNGNHNSLAISIDDGAPVIHQLRGKTNKIKAASDLEPGEHTITICKNTEASVGYIEMINITCDGLRTLPLKTDRKIEFIGNSTTAGSGLDASVTPCGQGKWYDQENAYESYGPITARSLDAQWHLSAVSGIGLVKSYNLDVTMPQVYDKINQSGNKGAWNFSRYQPHVIAICLGENDGVQDSVKFTSAYVSFIGQLRTHHPKAHIICMNSPMADASLNKMLKNYITGVVNYSQEHGDKNVTKFFFSRSFTSGCGGHPDKKEHQLMAKELSAYIASITSWTAL